MGFQLRNILFRNVCCVFRKNRRKGYSQILINRCYLLCSNDGANFKLLSGVERDCEAQNLSLPDFLPSSYRYFVIAVVGDVGADTTITGVELEIALAWNNRLGI